MSDFKGQMRTAVLFCPLLPHSQSLSRPLYDDTDAQKAQRGGGLSPRMGKGTAFIMLQVAESTRPRQKQAQEGQQQVWETQGKVQRWNG